MAGPQNALFVNNENGRAGLATEVAWNNKRALLSCNGWMIWLVRATCTTAARRAAILVTVDQAYSTQQVAMAGIQQFGHHLYTQMGVDGGFETVASFLPYNDDTGWTGSLLGGGVAVAGRWPRA